jgi:hypothetical protein
MKASQWRQQISILFVALFVAWEDNGEIPDIDAPPSAPNTKHAVAQAKMEKTLQKRRLQCLLETNQHPSDDEINRIKSMKMSRSLRAHYDAILQFSVAIRILSSNTISANEIKRGEGALSRAIQAFANMGCHLTPYFHLAMHIPNQLYKYGPCSNAWAWPYERNNGFLGRTNNNHHAGGEIECTMMRRWWRAFFSHDLISFSSFFAFPKLTLIQISLLEALPSPTAEDKDSIKLLKECIAGGTPERQGGYMHFLERIQDNERAQACSAFQLFLSDLNND